MEKYFSDNEVFSEGKLKDKNEDNYYFDNNLLVVVDGATDKSGNLYDGKTGGEIISELIVSKIPEIQGNGKDLIDKLNPYIIEMYKKFGVNYKNSSNIFSSTMVVCRITDSKIIITQVGDTSFRINGKDVYENNKTIDKVTSNLRKNFILEFGEEKIDESRNFILLILKNQFNYQNKNSIILNDNSLNELFNYIRTNYLDYEEKSDLYEKIFNISRGELLNNYGENIAYGTIDGTNIPNDYVKLYEFNINEVDSIEIFTDGYYSIPLGNEIGNWEKTHIQSEKEDPYKYIKYVLTKTKDDRTILISKIK